MLTYTYVIILDLKNTNKSGDTPLILAAYNGKSEFVRFLAEIGAKINLSSKNNTAALLSKFYGGPLDVTHILLANRADIYRD